MKINYQETTTDLLTRIGIHNKYGGKDIDKWMLGILSLNKGMKILDVSCGSGKQCFSFYKYLEGDCEITGGDVSQDMLEQAKRDNLINNSKIKFEYLDFNNQFSFEDNSLDLISCCFAIYYAENITYTLQEMHRILKTGGKLFTSGPMPNNKMLFYDIVKCVTDKPIPPMPGSSRYGSEILSEIINTFSNVKVDIFKNPLSFSNIDPFIQYTRASLSEDRKLWTNLFSNKDEFEILMQKIELEAKRRLDKEGSLIMTKVVGGFISQKSI